MSIYFDTEYVPISCGHESHGPGDLAFAVTRAFYDETRRTGSGWYCPLGHPRKWSGKTTEEQLREARTAELALQDQLSASIREGELTRQALLRDRQRFLNGVCVCCNRSFENVRRHMTSQHPDFDVAKVADGQKFQCSCGDSFTSLKGLRIHQGRRRSTGWDKPSTSKWSAHLTRV